MMSYRLDFSGVASPELSQLMRAVEGRLNWHAVNWQGVQAQAGDTERASARPINPPCKPGEACADNPPENPPSIIVDLIATFAIGLVAGVLIGYLLAKRTSTAR